MRWLIDLYVRFVHGPRTRRYNATHHAPKENR